MEKWNKVLVSNGFPTLMPECHTWVAKSRQHLHLHQTIKWDTRSQPAYVPCSPCTHAYNFSMATFACSYTVLLTRVQQSPCKIKCYDILLNERRGLLPNNDHKKKQKTSTVTVMGSLCYLCWLSLVFRSTQRINESPSSVVVSTLILHPSYPAVESSIAGK